MSTPRTLALLPLLLALSATACQRDQPAQHPYGPPGQLPQGAQPQPYGVPGQPAQGQGRLNAALTPFGVLFGQLPALPAQLPPLPAPDAWMQQYWPFPLPPPGPGPVPPTTDNWPPQWIAFEDEVLRETNAYRASGAVCGGKPFGPAAPLSPHPQLRAAARGHSRDMGQRGYFDHRSPEGVGPMQRAQQAGFSGGFVGENIAAGYPSPRDVVRGWIDSPGHCLNVMEPRYRYLGVGYVEHQDKYGNYWTQNFGG